MNLHEIISDAIAILHLGTEASSAESYAREFTRYANEAVVLISRKFRQTRTETVQLLSNNTFPTTELSHPCLKICWIQDETGRPLDWDQVGVGTGNIYVLVPVREAMIENVRVKVTYEFRPARLVNMEDVPELPEFAIDLIANYVAAKHCFSQDGASAIGSYHMQTFERLLNELPVPSFGERRSYELKGYNRGLI